MVLEAAPEKLNEFRNPGENANCSVDPDEAEKDSSDEFERKGVWLTLNLAPLGYKPPKSVKEAMEDKYWPAWRAAMDMEWKTLKDKDTMRVVGAEDMPSGSKPLQYRIVFDIKFNNKTQLAYKCKARVVAKGFMEVPGRTSSMCTAQS